MTTLREEKNRGASLDAIIDATEEEAQHLYLVARTAHKRDGQHWHFFRADIAIEGNRAAICGRRPGPEGWEEGSNDQQATCPRCVKRRERFDASRQAA